MAMEGKWHLQSFLLFLSLLPDLSARIIWSALLQSIPNKQLALGVFNNHVDKKGWVGGLKFAIFVHVYSIKNVHEE